MTNKKRNIIISSALIVLAIVFTIMVKTIDVKAIGANNTNIGFSGINIFIFNAFGVNMTLYHITDWLGFIPIIFALAYAITGIIQAIKRKSLLKVDKEIVFLGIFYIILVCLYIFFEKVIVNYRPILIDGFLEASYPSSHTLMAVCLCGSSIIINKALYNTKFSKIVNIASIVVMSIIVIGRLISGVHWFTDIIGGLIISAAMLMSLYTIIQILQDKKKQ